MKKEGIFIEVWVVTHYSTIEGTNYTNVFASCNEAVADFDKIASDAMAFALEEMADFRVSRNLNSLTICDVADDRVVMMCEVSKHTIQCGVMCM
jgi:hypothetical protein